MTNNLIQQKTHSNESECVFLIFNFNILLKKSNKRESCDIFDTWEFFIIVIKDNQNIYKNNKKQPG